MNTRLPDSILLQRWSASRDAEAFAEIVRRYAGVVHAACRRILGERGLAEDVSQDCFARLAEPGVRPGPSLGAWLHRVATNRALSVARSELRRRRREPVVVRDERSAVDAASWAEIEGMVDAVIAGLPETQRSLLVGHFLEGRTHAALASAMGVPRRTVSHRIRKAVEAVRAELRCSGAAVGASALGAGLTAHGVQAAPPSLIAALGKAAVAGPWWAGVGSAGAPAGAALAGGAGPKLGVAAVVVALALAGGYLATRPSADIDPHDTATTAGVAEPVQAAPVDASSQVPVVDPVSRTEAAAEPAAEEPVGTAALTGAVRAPGGLPIAGADVLLVVYSNDEVGSLAPDQIRRSQTFAATTDARGRYAIEGVSAFGAGRLSGFMAGFAGATVAVKLDEGKRTEAPLLQLKPGKTLRGRVVHRGAPVRDAVVTVLRAHDKKDYTRGWGFALTDDGGEFALGLHGDALVCSLRVNCAAHGQELFLQVATDAFAELAYRERATLRGRITRPDGSPARGVVVQVRAPLPDPRMQTMYSGWRSSLSHRAGLDDEGRYEITDLQPGMTYDPIVIAAPAPAAAGDGKAAVLRGRFSKPLTPQGAHEFTPEPGEVREWDATVAAKIKVVGRVRTAGSRRPAADVRIEVSKDGAALWAAMRHSDKTGAFELELTDGAGLYTFAALPAGAAGTKRKGASRGTERQLRDGDTIELELVVPEPVVLPLRVTDDRGQPVQSVQTRLHLVSRSGRRSTVGRPERLDAEGRVRLELFSEPAEVQVEITAFPRGPSVRTPSLTVTAGAELPEQHLTLPAPSGVSGTLQDENGQPVARADLHIWARYDDGTKDTLFARTGADGRFAVDGTCRAGSVVFVIMRDGRSWRSAAIDAPPRGRAELGVFQMK